MGNFWLTAIVATILYVPAFAADQQGNSEAKTPSVDITIEPPAPGHCPATATLECPRLLEAYSKAFQELSSARDNYFQNLATTAFPPTSSASTGDAPPSDAIKSQRAEVELALKPLSDLQQELTGLSNKAGSLFKTDGGPDRLGVFKYVEAYQQAKEARDAQDAAVETWRKDPFGPPEGISNKANLDIRKAAYFRALNNFYSAAVEYEKFPGEFRRDDVLKLAADIESVAARVRRDVPKSANGADGSGLAGILSEKRELWTYTKGLTSFRNEQLHILQAAYDKTAAAGREAMNAGAELTKKPLNTDTGTGIRILAALYGQNDYILKAYHRWRSATDDQIGRDMELIRETLRSGRSSKDASWELDPEQAMCDGTNYIKVRCEYVAGTLSYCRNKKWPTDTTIGLCTGSGGKDDYPDTHKFTSINVQSRNSAAQNCSITVLPDPFCGGPVAWSPTAGRNALIVYRCGAKSRQIAIGSNNQTLYMFCDGP